MAESTQQSLERDCLSELITSGIAQHGPAPAGGDAGQWLARLVSTIEGEIVPRLLLAHRTQDPETSAPKRRATRLRAPAMALEEFVKFALRGDVEDIGRYVESLQAQGESLEAICLDLLAPAARLLGEMWEADLCSFTDVTVALCRLQQTVHHLSVPSDDEQGLNYASPRVLLTATPGEQHTFGLVVVAEFFRRAGWDVVDSLASTRREIVDDVRERSFHVVGIAVGSETRVRMATALIKSIRRASRNRRVGIIVGGPLLFRQPQLAAELGADALATDGHAAVECARRFLTDRAAAGARAAMP